MTFAAAYLLALIYAPRRVRLVLILPLLLADCLGSLAIGESFHTTLSAKAWDCRTHPVWGWTYRAIDWLFSFQPKHCQAQWEREQRFGGVWSAWAASWRTPGPAQPPDRGPANT